jgi:hypothetical protein
MTVSDDVRRGIEPQAEALEGPAAALIRLSYGRLMSILARIEDVMDRAVVGALRVYPHKH